MSSYYEAAILLDTGTILESRTKCCSHGPFLLIRENRQIPLQVAIGAKEENQGEENREYGAAYDQEGLSHKVTLEKDLKDVKEQVM